MIEPDYTTIIPNMCGKYYDLQFVTHADKLKNMSRREIIDNYYSRYIRFQDHLKLVNINGIPTGQVHFVRDDGAYIVIPWCCIISMIPSKHQEEDGCE